MSGLGIAILAAGGATRFGGGKLDAMLGGKAIGQHVLDTTPRQGRDTLATVVAHPTPRFALSAAAAGQCQLIENPEASAGIGSSVARAAEWAKANDYSALLLLLADMPFVTTATMQALVESAGTGNAAAAVRYPDGRAGIPACFPRDWFATLMRLEGERGAASLLNGCAQVTLIDVPEAELRDIDTQSDLEEFSRNY